MVAVLALEVELAVEPGVSVDVDAIPALTRKRGPVGCNLLVDARDVLEHDPRLPADDALDLEAHARGGPRCDRAERGRVLAGGGHALVHLADVVELDPQPGGEDGHRAAPREADHTRLQDQRELVERLPEAHDVEQHVGLEIRRVVEDLHHPHRVDTLARAEERERDEIVGEAGVDARREARDITGLARALEQLRVPPRRGRWVHERDHGRRDDVRARLEDAGHVGDRVVGAQVTGRRVRDAVGSEGEHLVGVRRRRDADRRETRELPGVLAGLVRAVDEDAGELEVGMLDDAVERQPADVPRAPLHDAVCHAGISLASRVTRQTRPACVDERAAFPQGPADGVRAAPPAGRLLRAAWSRRTPAQTTTPPSRMRVLSAIAGHRPVGCGWVKSRVRARRTGQGAARHASRTRSKA